MKKRIISLLLCALMVASSFAIVGCTDDSPLTDGDIDTKLLTEITIYGIREPETTDLAIEKVEEALTEIAARKYNISINLLLFPEEEYASIIYNKTQSAMSKYNTTVEAAVAEDSDERELLKKIEYGEDVRVATDIPSDVVNANLDIFLVYTPEEGSPTLDPESEYYNPSLKDGGMFDILYELNALAGLDSYIKTGNFSALKSTAYAEALEYLSRESYKSQLVEETADKKIAYDYYGIPNNYAYGSYQFILFDGTYVDPLFSAEDKSLLAKPKQGESDPAELRALKQELKALQEQGKIPADVAIEIEFDSYDEYNEYIRSGKKFCIALVNGDRSVLDLCAESGQYDVYIRNINTVKTAELCDSIFCLSPSTVTYVGKNRDDSRLRAALNVLLLINTDEDFRNILQYGVKDTHYNLGKDGIAHITGMPNDKYVMDPKYCGNMFLIYPSDDMDPATQLLAANKWHLGKIQANDVIGAK